MGDIESISTIGNHSWHAFRDGECSGFIHKATHGWPKHIDNNVWDVAMERRDKKLMEMLSSSSTPN
ncbi:unnamed protein product [Coffea canephora]|uniref:Uncharacterized protein n=1 Tax=Coffea canephora TaxID=49390 RepID=A0A068U004_COFCA|nr:unnamed protein product [Coffea canephora]